MDSVSKEQEHNRLSESVKLCLNLCSDRWLKPSRNLVNSFIPYLITPGDHRENIQVIKLSRVKCAAITGITKKNGDGR